MLPITETFRAEFLYIYDSFEKAIVRGLEGSLVFVSQYHIFRDTPLNSLHSLKEADNARRGAPGVCASSWNCKGCQGAHQQIVTGHILDARP